MKQAQFNFFVFLCYFVCLVSCNSAPQRMLCDRNVYSRNGVATKNTYSYSAINGELDMASKSLYSIEKYDSLGNTIFYQGKYNAEVKGIDMSTYHYEIRSELDLPWQTQYTYKMEYVDTVFKKASVFNADGKYIARIEHFIHGNRIEDSVYVSNRLIYVQHIYKNVEHKDSLKVSYDNEYSRELLLAEEESRKYERLDNNVVKMTIVRKSRDIWFKKNHKYEVKEPQSYFDYYDQYGRIIKLEYGGLIYEYKYDENGNVYESTSENRFRHSTSKKLYKDFYYANGLHKEEYTYADMSVLESKSTYEYEFYPYSNTVLE